MVEPLLYLHYRQLVIVYIQTIVCSKQSLLTILFLKEPAMRSVLLTLLLASSLSVGCAILEDEQTTVDTGGATTAPAAPAVEEVSIDSSNFMTAGYDHLCAVRAEYEVVECWGLGDEHQTRAPTNPDEENYLGSGVKSVAAGSYHTCAIKADDS